MANTTKKTNGAKTTAAKKTTTSKTVTSAPATRAATTSSSSQIKTISKAERQRLIEQAAYFRAEKQGFQGNAQDHWASASAEIDGDLSRKKIRVV